MTFKNFRRAGLSSGSVAAAVLAVLAQSVPAYAQVQSYTLDIASQDLASALSTLARATQQQITFDSIALRGKRSPALKGRYSVREALDLLLAGSGLRVEVGQSGLLIVRAASNTPAAPADSPASEKRPASGAQAADANGALERVIVTGSRIERSSKSIPGSVTIFDRERIERTGESSVRDVIGQSGQAGITPTPLSAFLGAAPIQLRGLSAGTTLVLVDGRRVTPSGATGVTFDVGSIPLAAVERIEVLADGASAIYGADAVGGIVNVILKKSGQGLTLAARYGVAEGGVGEERRVSASYGFSSDQLRGSVSLDYLDTGAIRYGDRDPTRDMDYRRFGFSDRRSTFTDPGTVYSVDGSNLPGLASSRAIIPVTANGRPTVADFSSTAGQEKLSSDYFSQNYLQSPSKRIGGVADLTYKFNETLSAFGNVLASRQTAKYFVTLPFSNAALIVPASNPYNPFGVNVTVNRLLTGVSPDTNDSSDTFVHSLAGLRGKLDNGFRWEFAVNYSRDDNRVHEENYYNTAAIQSALNNPSPTATLNLFATGPVASPDVLKALLPPVDKSYFASAASVDGQLSGSLMNLAGGSLSFAVGADFRKDKLKISSPFDNTRGDRSVASVYAELRAPILENLTLSAAGRYDHYSDFGSTSNPKLGFEWTPTETLQFSGTWGTSFRAPPLTYVYSVPFIVQANVTDPARGGESVLVPATRGEGKNLKAETANTHTLGMRFTPLDTGSERFDVGVSAWWVSQDDRAISPVVQTLVDYENLFGNRIVRAPQSPQDIALGRPGALQSIDAGYLNFGKANVNGLDLQVNYRANGPVRWSLNGSATRVLKYQAELAPGAVENRLGLFSFDGFAPKWRGSLSGSVGAGDFDLSTTLRYIGSYADRRTTPTTLASRTFVDAQLVYEPKASDGYFKGVKLTLGASNLFGTKPPAFDASMGYDPYNYNNRGRFIYTSIQKRI